jgi:formylglycine-generating enzyme required for sulfatase activity
VRERQRFADSVREATIGHYREVWDQTIAAITASPRYGRLELLPQLGLVPIGADPVSGLFEFAHLQSGMVAVRDPKTGRIQVTPDTGIVFVLLPEGTFLMGAQDTDPTRPNHDKFCEVRSEGPVRSVAVAACFLAKHELTQGQWMRMTGSTGTNPSAYAPHPFRTYGDRLMTPSHPVESITWSTCTAVLRRQGLRLPTEAEWEFAARGGTSTPWHTGELPGSLQDYANVRDEGSTYYRGAGDRHTSGLDDGHAVHAPVGSFRPNDMGLHDVHGNVAEWCMTPDDTSRPRQTKINERILRGGGHGSRAVNCRSAARVFDGMDWKSVSVGCRAARTIE